VISTVALQEATGYLLVPVGHSVGRVATRGSPDRDGALHAGPDYLATFC
jgi:hypothetical protein